MGSRSTLCNTLCLAFSQQNFFGQRERTIRTGRGAVVVVVVVGVGAGGQGEGGETPDE